MLRFAESKYNDDHIVTIGVDFKTKALKIGSKKINLQLWDTAGQEKYKAVTWSYYKNSHGALAVYDITDRSTLLAVESLIAYYVNESESNMRQNVVLVGNKFDMATKHRQVSEEEGWRIAEQFDIPFYEISAKKNINVDEVFFEVSMQAMKNSDILAQDDLNENDKVKLQWVTGEEGDRKRKRKFKLKKPKCFG